MNKIFLCGRLTKDPEIRQATNSQTTIAKYSLAVNRTFKREGEPDADFFDCICFNKAAEFAEKYLKKGTKLLVTGRVQNNNYTNKDGQKVYSVQIMVEEQEFAESKASNDNANSQPTKASDITMTDGFMDIPTDLEMELPFA